MRERDHEHVITFLNGFGVLLLARCLAANTHLCRVVFHMAEYALMCLSDISFHSSHPF
jgi:hypothetical protein